MQAVKLLSHSMWTGNAPTISGASTSATGKYATSSFTVRASDSVSGVESLYMKAPNSSYYSSGGVIIQNDFIGKRQRTCTLSTPMIRRRTSQDLLCVLRFDKTRRNIKDEYRCGIIRVHNKSVVFLYCFGQRKRHQDIAIQDAGFEHMENIYVGEQRSRQLRPTAGIISAHRTRADYIRTRVRFVLIQASPREHYTAEQRLRRAAAR